MSASLTDRPSIIDLDEPPVREVKLRDIGLTLVIAGLALGWLSIGQSWVCVALSGIAVGLGGFGLWLVWEGVYE